MRTTKPAFGAAGEWVILGTSNGLHVFKETFSGSDAKFRQASLAVGVDRFVVPHFSIGLDAGAAYGDHRGYGVNTLVETEFYSLSGGFRLGYDVPLGQLFSWYPRLTLGISSRHTEATASVGSNGTPTSAVSSSIGPFVDLYLPVLFHLVPHVFVGFGPRVGHDFGVQRGGPDAGSQLSWFGGEFALGGWWGDGGTAADPSASAEAPGDGPFGKRGQFALGLATDAWVVHRNNSASTYAETGAGLNPSVDYFVADDFSIGVDAFINHDSGSSLDVSATRTHFSSTAVGVGPRFGSNVRVGSRCNFWPQVELGFGTTSIEQSSSEGKNQHTSQRRWLRLSGPLLFNVISHFLLGAGPYYFRELENTDQYGRKNQAQSVGARLVMVGWFGS